MIKNFIQKLKFLRNVEYADDRAYIIFDGKVQLIAPKSSRIIVRGILKVGGALPSSPAIPSYNKTCIILEPGSTLIIEDDVYIASGTMINIRRGATLTFKGKNYIGHNNYIMCSNKVIIGKNTSTSWNVTLIDHDGHTLYSKTGKPFKRLKKPLIIGDNVGIQMNVTIPTGNTIGENSLIGANSVVRENIPENTVVYHNYELRKKHGISAGLQFIT